MAKGVALLVAEKGIGHEIAEKLAARAAPHEGVSFVASLAILLATAGILAGGTVATATDIIPIPADAGVAVEAALVLLADQGDIVRVLAPARVLVPVLVPVPLAALAA